MDVLHTAIEVTDLDATREFYEDLLGLERSREYEQHGVRNYYVTGAGPGELQFRVVDAVPDPAGIDHIAIAADDVDATVETAVSEYGVTVEREPATLERVNRRLAALTDPDGYTVHLIEEL
ncbi:VOC family protein [Haloplanus halobius]|uniref:VOC family protein n=1 Tax=Haloplanus halobius TaxID=2934938 RepID=UPI002010AFB3|nr:VOC family protein [Haloplanus sp. XH21]